MAHYIITTEISSPIIQKVLFEHGYEWRDSKKIIQKSHSDHIQINGNKTLSFNAVGKRGKQLTFDELCELLNPQIKVGDHIVEFTDDGIKVGCTNVHRDVIREIYNECFGQN